MNADLTHAHIEDVVRNSWGRVLSILMSHLRDLELAEDVLQDALIAALKSWPQSDIPHIPEAWLLTTAKRKAIDRLRHTQMHHNKSAEIKMMAKINHQDHEISENAPFAQFKNEQLSLIFTCCHPALSQAARIALTLKAVGGLGNGEIARGLMLKETTVAQRIVRAKRKIKAANIPYRVPERQQWGERLQSVLWVIYFIFNEGYTATSGPQLSRKDLCLEAIELGTTLNQLIPDEAEVAGLCALMLLHDARREARCKHANELVQLEDQDRTLWNQKTIKQATKLLISALSKGAIGPYQLQAAISAVHANASHFANTDWAEITGLYERLYQSTPTPVVRLNAIVALSYAKDAALALSALNELEATGALSEYQYFYVVKADLLERTSQISGAKLSLTRAIQLATNKVERTFLEKKMLKLSNK